MEDIKKTIANNLAGYRKKAGLTQQQLAEKLNYSDKAVSKWERAEAIPDVVVLKAIADIYGIKVDDFFSEQIAQQPIGIIGKIKHASHFLVTCLSVGLVWLLAIIVGVVLMLIDSTVQVAPFIMLVALPVSIIVALVFSCIWGRLWHTGACVSALIWSVCVAFHLFLQEFAGLTNTWLVYIIGAACQVLVVLWFLLLLVLKKAKFNDKTFK